jgi:hypothetical protein
MTTGDGDALPAQWPLLVRGPHALLFPVPYLFVHTAITPHTAVPLLKATGIDAAPR